MLADSQGQRLPSDFKLTTGSTVNIYVQFIPYKMGPNSGVSLRLKGVQVIKYNEYTPPIEFDVVEGGYTMDGEDTPIDIPPVPFISICVGVDPEVIAVLKFLRRGYTEKGNMLLPLPQCLLETVGGDYGNNKIFEESARW